MDETPELNMEVLDPIPVTEPETPEAGVVETPATEAVVTKEPEQKTEEPTDVDRDYKIENAELRSMLRAQKVQLDTLNAKLSRIDSTVTASKAKPASDDGIFGEPAAAAKEEPAALSTVEQLQNDLTELYNSRSDRLQEIAEVMVLNPKYEDLYDVCNKENFEYIVHAVADNVSKTEGVSNTEALLLVETAIWRKPNPYKYMYDVIKTYHPQYAGKTAGKEEANAGNKASVASVKNVVEGKLPVVNPPGTIVDAGTSGADGGWTSARIDALSESELDQVPPDIYTRYMANELQ